VLDPYIDRLDQQVPHQHTEGGFELPTAILSGGQQGTGAEPTMPTFPSFDTIIEAQPSGPAPEPRMAERP